MTNASSFKSIYAHARTIPFMLVLFATIISGIPRPVTAMEEVVVTAQRIQVSMSFWDFVTGFYQFYNPNVSELDDIGEVTEFDIFRQRHQTTSCSSSVDVRAEWAGVQAGFASVGTVYRINYLGGGWQMWRITGQSSSGITVAEDSPCYSS